MKNRNESTAELIENASERIESATSNAIDEAKDLATSATFGTRTMVKAYPFWAVCGSISVGMLLGIVIRRAIK